MGRDGAGMGQGKYGESAGMGQGRDGESAEKYGEDTGKVTDYKGALWVMT